MGVSGQVNGLSFRIEDLDYDLPEWLIAQSPTRQRDASRLLIVDRRRGTLRDSTTRALPGELRSGDVMVMNDTRVVPAKIEARRATGGLIAGLFLRERGEGTWELLLKGTARLRPGERLALQGAVGGPAVHGDALDLLSHEGEGRWAARLVSSESTETVLGRVGRTPLPPYIRRANDLTLDSEDRERYQTVFARRPGAVAAPTAGLHLTDEMLRVLGEAGVEQAYVTLHVGLGTFAPIAADSLEQHHMHAEWYELPESTADRCRRCAGRGGRVVAVGTTTVRVLESCARGGEVRSGQGWTDIFIYPPHAVGAVDVLMTNFHLPRSTLLALVMAFAGVELTRRAYAHAVAEKYRFYSYGDAMLIV